jgi:hypothetical protein
LNTYAVDSSTACNLVTKLLVHMFLPSPSNFWYLNISPCQWCCTEAR